MTGYQPNFKLLNKLKVKFKNDEYKTPIYNKENMMTNTENVYLAGVVCGGLKLINGLLKTPEFTVK